MTTTTHSAIVVFTAKSVEHMMKDGGTQSWVLDKSNAKHCEYVVCCRSGLEEVEGPEPKGSAFLVGRLSDVVPSTEHPGRWLVRMSEFARVDLPDVWKGWRNPVRYTDLASLGIDPASLTFEPMPEPDPSAVAAAPAAPKLAGVVGLTIAEAKRGLAKTFSVGEEAIEITIRG